MNATHYLGSKGPVEIASMPYTFASNALAKLQRSDPSRTAEIAALAEHVATLGEAYADGADGAPPPIGDNRGPALDPEPPPSAASFPAIRAHLDDLLTESRNWGDGTAITSAAQAGEVARLIESLGKGERLADEARKAEREPHDTVIDEIQDRYNAYIAPLKNKKPGKVSLALDALRVTQTAWLRAQEAIQAAEAERLRKEAQAKIEAAAEALRASAGNIEAREEAEELFTEAKQAERAAVKAETAPVRVFGETRNMGLRDAWVTTISDGTAALRWAWGKYRPELESYALKLAQAEVRDGARTLPGFKIANERRVA